MASLTGSKARRGAAVLGQLGGALGGVGGPLAGAAGTAIGYGLGALGGAAAGAMQQANLKKKQDKIERAQRQGAGAGDREQALAEALPATQGALTGNLPTSAGVGFSGRQAGARQKQAQARSGQALAVVGQAQRADREASLKEDSARWKELQRQLLGEEKTAARDAGRAEAALGKTIRAAAGSEGTAEWADQLAKGKSVRGLPGWRDRLMSFLPEGVANENMTDDELVSLAQKLDGMGELSGQASRALSRGLEGVSGRKLNRAIAAGDRILGNAPRPGLSLEEFTQDEIDQYNK